MDVIEQLEFTHKWELSTREAHHIKTLNASLNCKIPTRTKAEYARDNRERLKEYKKQYHIDNRERIIKKSKQHYQANREARKEKNKRYHQVNREREIARRKKYYQDNKQKMLADMNQKIMCYCGASSSKSNLKRHQRTKKHHETFSRKIYDFIWS
jgi:CDGSH-type Zn-finger protein